MVPGVAAVGAQGAEGAANVLSRGEDDAQDKMSILEYLNSLELRSQDS